MDRDSAMANQAKEENGGFIINPTEEQLAKEQEMLKLIKEAQETT